MWTVFCFVIARPPGSPAISLGPRGGPGNEEARPSQPRQGDPAGPVRRQGDVSRALPAAAAATAAAATAATVTAAAAAGTARAGLVLGLVDTEVAAVELRAVHRLDRLRGARRIGDRHEAEAARAAGLTIVDHLALGDRPTALERRTERVRGRGPREAADEDLVAH